MKLKKMAAILLSLALSLTSANIAFSTESDSETSGLSTESDTETSGSAIEDDDTASGSAIDYNFVVDDVYSEEAAGAFAEGDTIYSNSDVEFTASQALDVVEASSATIGDTTFTYALKSKSVNTSVSIDGESIAAHRILGYITTTADNEVTLAMNVTSNKKGYIAITGDEEIAEGTVFTTVFSDTEGSGWQNVTFDTTAGIKYYILGRGTNLEVAALYVAHTTSDDDTGSTTEEEDSTEATSEVEEDTEATTSNADDDTASDSAIDYNFVVDDVYSEEAAGAFAEGDTIYSNSDVEFTASQGLDVALTDSATIGDTAFTYALKSTSTNTKVSIDGESIAAHRILGYITTTADNEVTLAMNVASNKKGYIAIAGDEEIAEGTVFMPVFSDTAGNGWQNVTFDTIAGIKYYILGRGTNLEVAALYVAHTSSDDDTGSTTEEEDSTEATSEVEEDTEATSEDVDDNTEATTETEDSTEGATEEDGTAIEGFAIDGTSNIFKGSDTSRYSTKVTDSSVTLSVIKSGSGKLSTAEDNMLYYGGEVDENYDFTLSGTVKVNNLNNLGSSNPNQTGFGIAVLDETYNKDDTPKVTSGAFGTFYMSSSSAETASLIYRSRTNNDEGTKGATVTVEKELAAGLPITVTSGTDTYEMTLTKTGQLVTITIDGESFTKEFTKDELSGTVYPMFFVARDADITITNLKFVLEKAATEEESTEATSETEEDTEVTSEAEEDTEATSEAEEDTEVTSEAEEDTEVTSEDVDDNTEATSEAEEDTEATSEAEEDTEATSEDVDDSTETTTETTTEFTTVEPPTVNTDDYSVDVSDSGSGSTGGVISSYTGEETVVKIPEEVETEDGEAVEITEIGAAAFKDSGIEEIIIPESVTKIADDAFEGLEDLTIFCDICSKYTLEYAEEKGIEVSILGDSTDNGRLTAADAAVVLRYTRTNDGSKFGENGYKNVVYALNSAGIEATSKILAKVRNKDFKLAANQ